MKRMLKDMVQEITTGQIMNRVVCTKAEQSECIGNTLVLVPGAISGGLVHQSNLETAALKKDPPQNRITKEGDIVLKLSSPYDCALLEKKDEGLLAPSYCGLLRGIRTDTVYPRFLAGYLNSHYAREQLLMGVNASASSMIRRHALQSLEILLPAMAEQILIGDAYWYSCQRKMIYERYVQIQQRMSDAIMNTAIQEVMRRDT